MPQRLDPAEIAAKAVIVDLEFHRQSIGRIARLFDAIENATFANGIEPLDQLLVVLRMLDGAGVHTAGVYEISSAQKRCEKRRAAKS